MRVLHVAETLKGGLATYLNTLIVHQVRSFGGDSVAVVGPEKHLQYLTAVNGVCFLSYMSVGPRVFKSFLLCVRVFCVLKNFRPDVVHMHSTFSGLFLRWALWLFFPRVKRVYCPHGWSFDRDAKPLVKRFYAFAERGLSFFDDAIVCISNHEYGAALAVGVSCKQMHVVLNGVADVHANESAGFPEWRDGCFRVLFVGRFDRQKGIDLLAKAMTLVGNSVHCIVVGGAVFEEEVDINFPKNMECVGWKNADQLLGYFESADVLLVPSRWEGFGLVAVEAMRGGTAVVAARVGGLAEIVKDGETGYLIDANSVGALVKALENQDRKKWCLMGEAGRRRYLDRFTSLHMHLGLLRVYEGLSER